MFVPCEESIRSLLASYRPASADEPYRLVAVAGARARVVPCFGGVALRYDSDHRDGPVPAAVIDGFRALGYTVAQSSVWNGSWVFLAMPMR